MEAGTWKDEAVFPKEKIFILTSRSSDSICLIDRLYMIVYRVRGRDAMHAASSSDGCLGATGDRSTFCAAGMYRQSVRLP